MLTFSPIGPQLLGRGLRGLPRDKVVVSTKVGKYGPGQPADFSGARVTRRWGARPVLVLGFRVHLIPAA